MKIFLLHTERFTPKKTVKVNNHCIQDLNIYHVSELVCWLVVLCLTALLDPQSITICQIEEERREKWKTREKMSKQPQPAPIRIAICPCSTIIQISKTPRHWKFTQNHRIPSSSTYPPTCQELPKLRPPRPPF